MFAPKVIYGLKIHQPTPQYHLGAALFTCILQKFTFKYIKITLLVSLYSPSV